MQNWNIMENLDTHLEGYNTDIMNVYRLTARIFDVRNEFQNTHSPIYERVCVSPPPYYLYWFVISYLNVTLNKDEGPFFIQCMNGIQGTKPSGRKWNYFLDAVVTIIKHNKIKIDNSIYINIFSDGKISCLTFLLVDVTNTTNNEKEFTKLTRVFEEALRLNSKKDLSLIT